jgi:hypothetical protein
MVMVVKKGPCVNNCRACVYISEVIGLQTGKGAPKSARQGHRGPATVFLVLEVTIIETGGIEAARTFDASSGLNLLKFGPS